MDVHISDLTVRVGKLNFHIPVGAEEEATIEGGEGSERPRLNRTEPWPARRRQSGSHLEQASFLDPGGQVSCSSRSGTSPLLPTGMVALSNQDIAAGYPQCSSWYSDSRFQ